MSDILAYITYTIIPAVGGAVIYFLKKHFTRLEKHAEEHEKRAEEAECRRTEKDLLVLKSLKAIGELTVANSIAIKNGKSNGGLEKAKTEFENVDRELHSFLVESAVKKVNDKK